MLNQNLNKGLFAIALFLFTTCNMGELDFADIDVPAYQGDNTIYIGEAVYTIQELISDLNDSTLEISEDNSKLLSVIYRDTTSYTNTGDLIQINDVENPGTVTPNITLPSSPIDTVVVVPTIPLTFEYESENNEELDSIWYSNGDLTLNIESSFDMELEYILTISDVINRETTDTLVFSGTLAANGTGSQTISLINHKTVLKRVDQANTFSGRFDGTLQVKTGDEIMATDKVEYTLTVEDAGFTGVFGWFGDDVVDMQTETIDLSFFQDISEDGLKFKSPEINFSIINSIGIPMAIGLDGISTTNASGTTVSLTGGVADVPQNIRIPSEIYTEVESLVTIDDQTNLSELLSISPTQMEINVQGYANYENSSATEGHLRNFVSDTSKIEVISELVMPFNVQLLDFSRSFCLDIEAFDFDQADTVNLVLITENSLPFDAKIGMQFMDADSVVTYDYPEAVQIIDSPPVGSIGRTEEVSHVTGEIPIDRGSGYQELVDDTLLNLIIYIDTEGASEDAYVKIYSDYSIKLTLSMQGNLNIEL